MDFYTAGTKMFPVPVRNDVPRDPDYESVLSISTKCSSYLRIIYLDIAADDSIVVVSVISLLFLVWSDVFCPICSFQIRLKKSRDERYRFR
jgi:hypothetical protein